MKTKILCLFVVMVLLFSTVCFATDSTEDVFVTSAAPTVVNDENTITPVDGDLFVSEDSYSLDTQVAGNVFASTKNFSITSRGIVNGDLFVVANDVTIKSDVTYSDERSEDGNNAIDRIKSYAVVNGNAFIACYNFTLEPGSEINGDLYIAAQNINIDKSCTISGNVFAVGQNISMNGKVVGSLYAGAEEFNMNYFGSVSKDLNVDAQNVNLNSVIHRNASIDAQNVTLNSDFLVYNNLEISALNTAFSGTVNGNAKIDSIDLKFVSSNENNANVKCYIKGDLNYSSTNELDIDEAIVSGDINYTEYVKKEDNTISFKNVVISFIEGILMFAAFVFVVCLLVKFIVPNYWSKENTLSVGNIFASFGIGLASIVAVPLAFILLLVTIIGVPLAFVLLLVYACLIIVGLPVLVLDIAKLFKDKFNIYGAIILVAALLYLISKIPVLGGLVMFFGYMVGIGRIIINMFKRD